MREINANINKIINLCNDNRVVFLFAFGSVIKDNLKPDSDIDLFVDIDENDPLKYSDYYFNVKFELEKIFDRDVDLLEKKGIRNPYLKKQIEKTGVLIYEK